MNQRKKGRLHTFCVPLLIAYIFYAQGVLVNHARILWQRRAGEPGVRYEERLGPLRELLPGRGIAGYASDTGSNEFFLRTQYVLAPVVLDRGPAAHPLVVANCSQEEMLPDTVYGRPCRVVKNYHNGVALLSLEPTWNSSLSILLLSR